MTPTQQWWDRFANAVRAADLDSAEAMVHDLIMSETPSPEGTTTRNAERYQWLRLTHLRELLNLFHTADTSAVGLDAIIDEAIERRKELQR